MVGRRIGGWAVVRKKSLSKHLSRREPDDKEITDALLELHAGSDRVAAIMGAALIETYLVNALEAGLSDASDRAALFHDQGAPFGTFKARIVAGKALGLFGADIAEDLDVIRDIRNQFAHALLSIDFSNAHIVEACERMMGGYPEVKGHGHCVGAARGRYEGACLALTLHLAQFTHGVWKDRYTKAAKGAAAINDIISSLESRGYNVRGGIAPEKL